jgi:hypothetical protein
VASLFTVGLEMAKQGMVEIRQDGLFRPIYLRASDGQATPHVVAAEYSNEQTGADAEESAAPAIEEQAEEEQSNDGT